MKDRFRIAAVSYLNTRPLIHGLQDDARVALTRDVPSALLGRLENDQADAALLSVIDLQRSRRELVVVPAGCISSAGPTLTVRIFSRVEAADIRTLYADTDSHTSVALAAVLWQGLYGRPLEIRPHRSGVDVLPDDAQAVLLIGDKVVTSPPAHLPIHLDLGQLWFDMTGLPFVFAVWTAIASADLPALHDVLLTARRQGASQIEHIVRQIAPSHGWPEDLARQYLSSNLGFEFTPAHQAGLQEFFRLAARAALVQGPRTLRTFQA